MPFKKGHKKVPGSGLKKGQEIDTSLRTVKKFINKFAIDNYEDFQKNFNDIKDPRDKCKIYIDCLKYVIPTMQSVAAELAVDTTFKDELMAMSNEDNL